MKTKRHPLIQRIVDAHYHGAGRLGISFIQPEIDELAKYILNEEKRQEAQQFAADINRASARRPSIGDIVLLHLDLGGPEKTQAFAAIVTGIHEAGLSLQVFWDPMRVVESSIKYYAAVPYSATPQHHTWSWPGGNDGIR
jgi:hypothetical protein